MRSSIGDGLRRRETGSSGAQQIFLPGSSKTCKDEQLALMRKREVLAITGWSNSTLYNRLSAQDFPRPLRTGPRTVGWLKSEVLDYVNQRITERDARIAAAFDASNKSGK